MSQPNRRFERKIVKLNEIKEDPTNPNSMNAKQEAALKNSVNKFGYVDEIVVDKKTMMIADGFHRYQDLKKKGITEAEVKLFNFKNETERKLFRQVFNKLRGSHDPEKDAFEFKSILETLGMEDFVAITAQTEQDILNIINLTDKEVQDTMEKNRQEMDVTMEREIVCPKCGEKIRINKKNE